MYCVSFNSALSYREALKVDFPYVFEGGSTIPSSTLMDDILAWRVRLSEVCEGLRDVLDGLEEVPNIWEERLCLPSEFSTDDRRKYKLEALAKIELTLRKGEAHDALECLRRSVRHVNQYHYEAQKKTRPIDTRTRFGNAAMDARKEKIFWAAQYRRVRQLMLNLGLPDNHEILRSLNDKDMYRPSTDRPLEFNTGKEVIGWIWTVSTGKFSASDNRVIEDRDLEGSYLLSSI